MARAPPPSPTALINPWGTIAGYYQDQRSNVYHGFVRGPRGTIANFDVPGAGTGSGQGVFPFAFSLSGAVTGYYCDANNLCHGFVRLP